MSKLKRNSCRRLNNLLSDKYNLSQCPNCRSTSIQDLNLINYKEICWRIFPTMLCLDCKHEWIPRRIDKDRILDE